MNDTNNSGRVIDKARAVKWGFFTLLVLINAGLTSSFFVSNYSNSISIVENATLNKWLTVLVGIVLMDIGALAWLYLYENLSYTARARNVAQFMSWAALIASTIASVAQLILTNTLVVLGEDVTNGAALISLLGVAGILIAHVFAMMLWLQASPEARRLDAEMEARAEEVERELSAERELAAIVAKIANGQIKTAIPVLARIQARNRLNGFITAHGNLPMLETGEVDRAGLSALFPELAQPTTTIEDDNATNVFGDLDALVDALVEERLAERVNQPTTPQAERVMVGEVVTPVPSANGHGHDAPPNFTNRPNIGRRM